MLEAAVSTQTPLTWLELRCFLRTRCIQGLQASENCPGNAQAEAFPASFLVVAFSLKLHSFWRELHCLSMEWPVVLIFLEPEHIALDENEYCLFGIRDVSL